MSVDPPRDSDAIAILAVAGRFPGAAGVEQFWSNLCAGVESIRRYSNEELDALGIPAAVRNDPAFVPAGALLDDIDRFDAALFGFTPREAEILDPQHRLFFECVWDVFERAGYAPGSIEAPVGLFAGTSFSAYLLQNLIPDANAIRDAGIYQAFITNDKDSLTTYVSYKLHLRGPSITLQTACSTSLVAVQFACQSLLGFQCDMAVAGGVSLQVPHVPGYIYQPGSIASPDGHCRPFDADAAGTVPGSGVGCVLLKRLEDAIADGDQIVAVIRGGAVNNDGAAKVGYTAPGADGQAEVIALAYAVSGVEPDSIGYVEAHGTATPLGDPVEAAALTRVFRAHTFREGFCALGSVKSNIGHLDTAAGVAGLIKAALAVQHGRIPANLHFRRANPRAALDGSPFFVPTETIAWPQGSMPRRAAVSSFGIGGTNVHVVLEEAPVEPPNGESRTLHIVSLSARSEASLTALARDTADRLAAADAPPLADAAFTLHTGRRAWPHRLSVISRSAGEAAPALLAVLAHRSHAKAVASETPIAFLFPDRDAAFPGMARALRASEETFGREMDECCARLPPGRAVLVREYLLGDVRQHATTSRSEATSAQVDAGEAAVSQSALFVFEYALARVWLSWGVTPQAMLGRGIGEYAAACLSGVLSVDAALALVNARPRVEVGSDARARVGVEPDARARVELEPDARARVDLEPDALARVGAGNDAPGRTVPVAETIEPAAGGERTPMATNAGSPAVALPAGTSTPGLAGFRRELETTRLSPPSVPFLSGLTGDWITAQEATDHAYWLRHLGPATRVHEGLRLLLDDPRRVALEVGPGQTLTDVARHLAGVDRVAAVVPSMPAAGTSASPNETLTTAVSTLWTKGVTIDWSGYHRGERRRRVLLPTTPFERQRYWIDGPTEKGRETSQDAAASVHDWLYSPEWKACPLSTAGAARRPPASTLVIGPTAIAASVAARLRERGSLGTVIAADDPAIVQADAVRWFRGIMALTTQPAAICVLSTLADGERPWTEDDARRRAVHLPIAVIRAAADAGITSPIRMILVVNLLHGGIAKGGDDTLVEPLQALAAGAAVVGPQEYPNLSSGIVDIEAEASAPDWIDPLVDELASTPEAVVAYRGGQRYVRSFRRASSPRALLPLLRRDGVYWITGATGGIGQALAHHLARTYHARLILTARHEVPPTVVAEMAAAGGTVLTLAADAADPAQMRQVRIAAVERFGRIDGIIHAAGIPGGGVIAFRTPEAIARVLAPKVAGTRAVAEAARDAGVQFVVLCSSLSAVQGGFGQFDYVAANAFLDQFAAWHAQTSGIPTFSIGWDGWREVGMAVAAREDLRRRSGQAEAGNAESFTDGLSTRDGIAVFERVLAGSAPWTVVSVVPLADRLRRHRDTTALVTATAGRPASAARTLRSLSVEAQVAAIWHRTLGLERVASDASFFDVGGDSLKGVELVAHLNAELGTSIPVARFFGAPTISALSALVHEHLGGTTPHPSDSALDASRERGQRRAARRAQRGLP